MRADGLPGHPTHDDVRLTRRERRMMARIEADVETAPAAAARCRRRTDPAASLVVGLVLLLTGAITASEPVVVTGIVLSVTALVCAAVSS